MKKLCVVFVTMVLLASCIKEKSIDSTDNPGGSGGTGGGCGTSGSLIGNWKFAGFTADTENSVEVSLGSDQEKTVTLSKYSSTDNVGTYTFTASKMTMNGVGYSVSTTAKAYLYENAVLIDSFEAPFTFTLPGTSGETNYKKVGTDSLYFEGGTMSIPSAGAQTAQPSGVKYRFEGDKLILTTIIQQRNVTDLGGGVTQVQVVKATAITTLQK